VIFCKLDLIARTQCSCNPLRRPTSNIDAFEADRPAGRPRSSKDDVEEGRLPGSVWPNQRRDGPPTASKLVSSTAGKPPKLCGSSGQPAYRALHPKFGLRQSPNTRPVQNFSPILKFANTRPWGGSCGFQGNVLVGCRVGEAGNQPEARFADPRPDAVQEPEQPDRRID